MPTKYYGNIVVNIDNTGKCSLIDEIITKDAVHKFHTPVRWCGSLINFPYNKIDNLLPDAEDIQNKRRTRDRNRRAIRTYFTASKRFYHCEWDRNPLEGGTIISYTSFEEKTE